jgi:hypothetical protein
MSELSIFLFGVLVFFMCGCAAVGPFLYSAWRAEQNWLQKNRKQKNLPLSRPASRTIAEPVPVQVRTHHAA